MTSDPLSSNIKQWSELANRRLDSFLKDVLPQKSGSPTQFNAAVHYTLENGGKRLRPVLVYMTADMFGANPEQADAAAAAVELIHTYSLVHDDLPAMDDDDLRRGKPSCHCAFDEATAILVGDALQALAFEVLSKPCDLPASNQLAMIQLLAHASGLNGMCKGQALDIEATQQVLSLEQLKAMHEHKTGALIKASILLGAHASNRATADDLATLEKYADCVGLAFQVRDDILDVIGTTESLGKPQGSDIAAGKVTYTQLLGLEKATTYATKLCEQGKDFLTQLQHNSHSLSGLADYINQRVA